MVKKKRPPFALLGGVNKTVLGLQGLTSNRRALGDALGQCSAWLQNFHKLVRLCEYPHVNFRNKRG